MNYRHAFHAGNHCDVLKHLVLCLILEKLKAKDKPFAVLDTHAGRGLYDLTAEEARRAGEHLGGVTRFVEDPSAPAALEPYLRAVRAQNPFGGVRWYPGSPVIIRDAMRAGDSAKFCELNWREREALETTLNPSGGRDPRIKVFERDGYEAVRAFLPPGERRGLVLIDPPFEKPGEFERLAEALADGLKRWASGVFAIWRPIKNEKAARIFLNGLAASGAVSSLEATLEIAPRAEDKLTGSAMHVLNPPFGLAQSLVEALPYLAGKLRVADGASWSVVETEKDVVIVNESGRA